MSHLGIITYPNIRLLYQTTSENMEVITFDSDAYKELINKLDAIARYIKERDVPNQSKELDEVWVDSYEVCTFLRISERTLQRLRSNSLISYSVLSGKTYYTIGEIKRILQERLIKSGEEALNDLINSHKQYLERRKRNKPKK